MGSIQAIFTNAKPVSVHGLKIFLITRNSNGGLVSIVPNGSGIYEVPYHKF
jgi:hypothetical protein